jgi:hypothetical protein
VLYRTESPGLSAVIEDRGALWAESFFADLFATLFTVEDGHPLAAWIP